MISQETSSTPYTFAIVLVSKFSMLTLSSLVDPLRIANFCHGDTLYKWRFLSADGADVLASNGIPVATEAISMDDLNSDTIIVCGGWNAERYDNPELIRWLQNMARHGLVIGAADVGTHVLARAGLLSGYEATINWNCFSAFEECYPHINLKEQLFVSDRKRLTCAGGAACLDMMLHDIGQRHSKTLASEVAEQMIYSEMRGSEAPQKEIQVKKQPCIVPIVRRAIDIMETNIEEPITIPHLSGLLDVSQRKLERLFNKYYSCSTVAFYRALRLQHARTLLTQTDMSVIDICIACGFTSSSYFSKSYHDQFGVRPSDHRTAWPDTQVSPLWPGISKSMAASNPKVRSLAALK